MNPRFILCVPLACSLALVSFGCARDTQHGGRESVSAPTNKETHGELASARVNAPQTIGNIETIAYFNGPMPTGVTVSRSGRIFVCYPKWGDPVKFTVAEIKGGEAVAYPSEKYNTYNPIDPSQSLVSVQSVVVDSRDRLWMLDTGSTNFGAPIPGAAKLVCVNLETGEVAKTITFPPTVALPTTYLNDVRFDLRRGNDGMAFITDSADKGPNGIIVVDLSSGKSWRRLNDDPSTKADPTVTPTVEGQKLMVRNPPLPTAPLTMGSDGIAINPDGKTLYYCPLVSHHLYSVSIDALADQSKKDAEVAATVQDLGDRGFASDGLECDGQGRLYLTDYENDGVRIRDTGGGYRFVARSAQIIWPDTLAISSDGYLYFTNNQLNRQPRFNDGKDLRQPPYTLMRVKIDGTPEMANRGTEQP